VLASDYLARQQPAAAASARRLAVALASGQSAYAFDAPRPRLGREEGIIAPRPRLGREKGIMVLGVALTPSPQSPNTVVPAVLLPWTRPAVATLIYGGSTPGGRLDDNAALVSDEFSTVLSGPLFQHAYSQAGPFAVIALPPPAPQVGPGEEAHCGGPGGPGTFGARVTYNDRDALLIAGHTTASIPGAAAYDANLKQVGGVVYRSCFEFDNAGAPVPARTDIADIGVVQLSRPDPSATPMRKAVATIWDTVAADGAVTKGQTSALLTVGTAFGTRSGCGNWGQAMLTAYAISAPGDSGACVTNAATGALVGHVVGGYTGVYSVIQDVEYQLNAIGARLR
jgi:hypothetical protein